MKAVARLAAILVTGLFLDAGAEAASRIGELVSAHVIARPHEGLLDKF